MFKVNTVMYEFDPAILMLAGCFFIVLMVFTFWCAFGVAGTGCSFLCVVPLSGALIKQAWW